MQVVRHPARAIPSIATNPRALAPRRARPSTALRHARRAVDPLKLWLPPPPNRAETGAVLRQRLRHAVRRLDASDLPRGARRLHALAAALRDFQADTFEEAALRDPRQGRLTTEERAGLAEVGWHYSNNGGHALAAVVFEGLVELEPRDAYGWMGLGHVHARAGERRRARACLTIAGRLDPADPSPDLAIAALHLEEGNLEAGRGWAEQARAKAERRKDAVAVRRADALLARAEMAVPTGPVVRPGVRER